MTRHNHRDPFNFHTDCPRCEENREAKARPVEENAGLGAVISSLEQVNHPMGGSDLSLEHLLHLAPDVLVINVRDVEMGDPVTTLDFTHMEVHELIEEASLAEESILAGGPPLTLALLDELRAQVDAMNLTPAEIEHERAVFLGSSLEEIKKRPAPSPLVVCCWLCLGPHATTACPRRQQAERTGDMPAILLRRLEGEQKE